MDYVVVKWIHILSSTLLFGTGLGSAFYMFFIGRTGDSNATAIVVRYVVLADWLFTTPTILLQPASGLYLAHRAGFALTSRWLLWSMALFLLAGAAWLPVVWMQIRMRDMAREAAQNGRQLPPKYRRLQRYWVALGVVAFMALVVVFFLMVAKPT